jgi:Rrf2 family protein
MQLTRAADYAARVMIHLAGMPADSRASRSELAAAAEVPQPFLGKILQSLVRSGLIHSQRGASGGFVLGRPPAEVTLLDVIEAIEGPLFLNRCLNPEKGVIDPPGVRPISLWVEAQAAMSRSGAREHSRAGAFVRREWPGSSGNSLAVCVLEDTISRRRPAGGLTAWN